MGSVCCAEQGGHAASSDNNDEKLPANFVDVRRLDPGKLQFLEQVKLFKSLTRSDLPALASSAEPCEFEIGQVIVKQGDEGHDFYVLKSGEAEVIVDGVKVVTLSSGDYFGESSLLMDEPRSATVQAFTRVTALKVSRENFNEQQLQEKLEFPKRQAVGGGHMQEDCAGVKPPSPKNAVEMQLMRKALLNNSNLQTMVTLDDSRLTQLIEKAWKESVPTGKELITEGDLSADYFYIVQSGCFDVVKQETGSSGIYVRNNAANAAEVFEARPGDSFGELALLYFAPRAATVTARVDSVVWVIHRASFKAVLAKTQGEILDEYKVYLSKVAELSALLADEQEVVANSLTEITFFKDEEIFKQGEQGKDFYILVEGEVAVMKDGKEAALLTATRERSHCFGEKALLHDTARTATIKVTSDKAKALSLDKATFDMLLGPLAAIQKRGKRGRSMVNYEPVGEFAMGDCDRTFGNILFKDLTKVGLLGCGGFGHVELVEHEKTRETYALKALSKGYIVKCCLQRAVMSEKTVQLMCNSDFIIKLYETYSQPQNLFLLLELALGGELYATYTRRGFHGRESYAKYYAGGVVLALEHMHSRKIIFRDLKPENILLNNQGHIKVTDMGLAKVVIGKTYTTCGTPDYFAPEVVNSKGHCEALDWWTLGILIFELMVGHTPFESPTPMMIYQKVIKGIGRISFPAKAQGATEEIIKALCKLVPSERLPMKKGGTDNIKRHRWYSDFAWETLEDNTMKPPYVPKVTNNKDLYNFSSRAERPPSVFYEDDKSGWDGDFATSE